MVSSTFKYSYIHQPTVTTFAFSSVFILLLWWEGTECKMSAYGGLNNWNNSNTTAQYSLYCYYLKIMFFGKFSLFRQVHSTGTCKNCFTKYIFTYGMEWKLYIVEISMIYDFLSTVWVNIHWNSIFADFFLLVCCLLLLSVFRIRIYYYAYQGPDPGPNIFPFGSGSRG